MAKPTIIKSFPGQAVDEHLKSRGILPGQTDYAAMSSAETLTAMGDDAEKWAAAFCQIRRLRNPDIDEAFMIGWFANAIEHSTDIRMGRNKTKQQPSPPMPNMNGRE